MYAANNEGIRILGAILLRLSGKDSTGHEYETAEMVYISDSTDFFYLSRHAMEQLQIIGPNFPSVGAAALLAHPKPGAHSVSTLETPEKHCLFEKAECGCYLCSFVRMHACACVPARERLRVGALFARTS